MKIMQKKKHVVRKKDQKDLAVTRGSGNIFSDLGLPNAEEHLLKAKVVMLLAKLISDRNLTQKEAASLMEVSQPDVSKIMRGRFDGFSLERLLGFVRALGRDVEIKFPERDDEDYDRRGRLLMRA
jgi:predicted XRE-type DNA-binding protein